MKSALIAAIVGVSIVLSGLGQEAHSKSFGMQISPGEGELGTTVQLTGESPQPDADVLIFAATSPDGSAPHDESYVRLATARSDSEGQWSAEITIESTDVLEIAESPGFVMFKTQTVGLEMPPIPDTGAFIITSGDRRPSGAGGFRITLSLASGFSKEKVLLGWRTAGTTVFHAPQSWVVLPVERTMSGFPDGDYEIVAVGVKSLVPVGDDAIREVPGFYCIFSDCGDPGPADLSMYPAKPVTIRNGTIADVNFVLGRPSAEDSSVEATPVSEGGGSGVPYLALASVGILTGFVLFGSLAYRSVRNRRRS